MRRRTNPASTELYDQDHAQWEKNYNQNKQRKIRAQNRAGYPIQTVYERNQENAEDYQRPWACQARYLIPGATIQQCIEARPGASVS